MLLVSDDTSTTGNSITHMHNQGGTKIDQALARQTGGNTVNRNPAAY